MRLFADDIILYKQVSSVNDADICVFCYDMPCGGLLLIHGGKTRKASFFDKCTGYIAQKAHTNLRAVVTYIIQLKTRAKPNISKCLRL